MSMNLTLMPRDTLADIAPRFRLLGDAVRLELLNLLHVPGAMHVQLLVDATGQSQANVSKHLRRMAAVGFVARRKEGLYGFYRIADPSLAGLCLLMCSQVQRVDGETTTPMKP